MKEVKRTEAQYYFEYRILAVENGLNLTENDTPKLYVETAADTNQSGYKLFLVLPSWLEPEKKLNKFPYTAARIVFNPYRIDFSDAMEDSEVKIIELDIAGYRETEYAVTIQHGFNLSGVATITLSDKASDGTEKSTVYEAAINFRPKSVIRYTIKRKGVRLALDFKCGINSEKIKVRALYKKDSLPCLKTDFEENIYEEITVEPDRNGLYRTNVENKDNMYVYLALEQDCRFYVLECTENETLPKISKNPKRPRPDKICPYCHQKINLTNARYKEGSISCQGRYIGGDKPSRFILQNGKRMKRSVFCEEDCTKNAEKLITGLNPAILRLLPERYWEFNSHKIAILGSKRAGKSTFISRFFDVTGTKEGTNITLKTLGKNTASFASVKPYGIKSLNNEYTVLSMPWYKSGGASFYETYSISSKTKSYPEPTDRDKSEVMTKPFIVSVNQRDYVSFYDIAGEDAQQGRATVNKLKNGTSTGIFFLVDGNKNISGNDEVINTIIQNFDRRLRDCPMAVILTKFDLLESKFDRNALCLRDNLEWYRSSKYEGSPMETMINISSEEIKAYVSQNIFDDSKLEGFKNRKYFCVSSFSTSDAIYHENPSENTANMEVNKLKFQCSSKRMELPFIWMMKQLGIII